MFLESIPIQQFFIIFVFSLLSGLVLQLFGYFQSFFLTIFKQLNHFFSLLFNGAGKRKIKKKNSHKTHYGFYLWTVFSSRLILSVYMGIVYSCIVIVEGSFLHTFFFVHFSLKAKLLLLWFFALREILNLVATAHQSFMYL